MFVKFRFEAGMSVMDVSRFVGCAPCSILAVNKCSESELYGREIWVPVSTPHMIRSLSYIYQTTSEGKIQKMLLT